MKTLQVSRGHQYNRNGYRTSDGAYGEVAERMDGTTGLTVSDGPLVGYDYDHSGQQDAIRAAIMETLADGQTRTVSLKDRNEVAGEPAPVLAKDAPASKQLCPKCGTYCHGDC